MRQLRSCSFPCQYSRFALLLLLGASTACGADHASPTSDATDDVPITGGGPTSSMAGSTATSGGSTSATQTSAGEQGVGGSTALAGSAGSGGSAGGGGPQPNLPSPPTAGWWTGKTDGSKDVLLHVTGKVIDAALMRISVNLGIGTCSAAMVSSGPTAVVDSVFNAEIALDGSDFTGTLSGTFATAAQARGKFEWSGAAILCGTTLSVGSGFAGDGTWSATPIACPFQNDHKCDEPDVCPAGSDAADCGSNNSGGSGGQPAVPPNSPPAGAAGQP